MTLYKENARFLDVKYHRPDDNKYKHEFYNLLQLHKLSDSDNKIRGEGISYDLSASDYLKQQGCDDERVSRYNVLRLTYTAMDFERIFVFFDDRDDLKVPTQISE